jgi:hypothetical protein
MIIEGVYDGLYLWIDTPEDGCYRIKIRQDLLDKMVEACNTGKVFSYRHMTDKVKEIKGHDKP